MTKLILAASTALAGLALFTVPAHACPSGYKRVWVQGNPICQLDASASGKLKAATKPKPSVSLPAASRRQR